MLRIEADHRGWDGTAALVIGHAIEDILSDGAPVEATLTVELEYGGTRTFKATLLSIKGGSVTGTSHVTGARFELDTEEITSIQFD